MRKLEIGSGSRPQDGYEHLDLDPKCPHLEYVAPMDNIPVEDNTFSEVYSVHVIEHQSWRDTKKVLEEWYRVLAKEGTVYLATPNLKFITEMYIDGMNGGDRWIKDYNIMHPEEQAHIRINGIPNLAKWANFKLYSSTGNGDVHYACLDSKSIIEIMKEIGFQEITIQSDTDSLVVRAKK